MKRVMVYLFLAAGCQSPPAGAPTPAPTANTADAAYPQAPMLTADYLERIPGVRRDADGGVIVFEIAGVPVTLGPPRKDAIGAAARCRDLGSACLIATKDLDMCAARLPACKTVRPWEEATPCCAQACIDAYLEQRRFGASAVEADRAVFGSTHECFPGLQEQYRAAGGTPYLAPRRVR